MNTTKEPTRAEFHQNRAIANATVDAVFDSWKAAAKPVVTATPTTNEWNPRNSARILLVRVGNGTKKHASDGISASCGADRHGWNYSELRPAGYTSPNSVRGDVTCARCRAMFGV